MDNEEKLDKIMEMVGDLKITINGLSKDLESHIQKTDDRMGRMENDIKDAKEARKVIHQRADATETRIMKIETDPMFAEWKAIKGRLFSVIWAALIVIGLGIVLNALPSIIKIIQN